MNDGYKALVFILANLDNAIKQSMSLEERYPLVAFHNSVNKIIDIVRRKKASQRTVSIAMLVVSQNANLKVNQQTLQARVLSNKQVVAKTKKYIRELKKSLKQKQLAQEQCNNAQDFINKALSQTQQTAKKIGVPIIEHLDEKKFFQWEGAINKETTSASFPLKRLIDVIFEDVANVFKMEIPNDVMLRGYRALDEISNMRSFFLHGITIEKAMVREIRAKYFAVSPIANRLDIIKDWKEYFAMKKYTYFSKHHQILNQYRLAVLSSQLTQEQVRNVNEMLKDLINKDVAITITGDVFNSIIAFLPVLKNQYIGFHRAKYQDKYSPFTVTFQRIEQSSRLFLSLKQLFFVSFQVKKTKILVLFRKCSNFDKIATMLKSIEKQIFG